MNFSGDDVHRSLRRYVGVMLGQPWKIRTERQPVTPDDREVCVVEPASPVTTGRHRMSIPQGNVEKLQAFSVVAYPELGPTGAESRQLAQEVADLLDTGFSSGLVDDAGANIGGPFRLPVYDFDDVPVKGRSRRGGTVVYGYADVRDLNVRALQDGLDHRRFTVVCDLRLMWERGGRLSAAPGSERVAKAMPGKFKRP